MLRWDYIMGWYIIRKDRKIVFQTKSKRLMLDSLKKMCKAA